MSVIDRVINTKSNDDWEPFTADVLDWMTKNYSIADKKAIAMYPDLKELKHKVQEDIDYMYTREQSFKLLMNSCYGGSSHQSFYWYNMAMANDITGEGRNLIHMMEDKTVEAINDFVNRKDIHEKLGIEIDKEKYDKTIINNEKMVYTIYQDTDSLKFDSLMRTNNGTKTIEQLYNENLNKPMGGTIVGHESVGCDDLVLNYKDGKLQFNKVKRVIRHKVTKKKWRLRSASGKEVICTNDHSLVVFRNGAQIVVRPFEIQKGDKILTIIEK